MRIQKEVKIGGHYLNKRNKKNYIVLHTALASWDVYQDIVVYQREDKDAIESIWVRSLWSFNEEFELLD